MRPALLWTSIALCLLSLGCQPPSAPDAHAPSTVASAQEDEGPTDEVGEDEAEKEAAASDCFFKCKYRGGIPNPYAWGSDNSCGEGRACTAMTECPDCDMSMDGKTCDGRCYSYSETEDASAD